MAGSMPIKVGTGQSNGIVIPVLTRIVWLEYQSNHSSIDTIEPWTDR